MIRAAASRFGDVLFLRAAVIVVLVGLLISSVHLPVWNISSFSSIIFLASSDVFDLSFLNLFVDVGTGLDTDDDDDDVDVVGVDDVFNELLLASRGVGFLTLGGLAPGS